jgi:hypothetical protein
MAYEGFAARVVGSVHLIGPVLMDASVCRLLAPGRVVYRGDAVGPQLSG